MTVEQDLQIRASDTDLAMRESTRRTLLRRGLLGITGLGLASLLAACGGDDDDEEDGPDNVVETVESEGDDAVDEVQDEVDDAEN